MRFAIQAGLHRRATSSSTTSRTASTCSTPRARGAPKMMSVGLHCRLVGRPGRAAALARFLDYVAGHEQVWVCRRVDIARHWHEQHAASDPAAGAPHARSRRRSSSAYGHVFEHSPWIAEAAWDAGLPADADTAEGLHGPCAPRWPPAPAEREARADPGPPRPCRQARAGRAADRGIDQRAGLGRARPADRSGARHLHRAQRRLPARASAFPSSSPSRA